MNDVVATLLSFALLLGLALCPPTNNAPPPNRPSASTRERFSAEAYLSDPSLRPPFLCLLSLLSFASSPVLRRHMSSGGGTPTDSHPSTSTATPTAST